MTFQPAPASASSHEDLRQFLALTLPTLRRFDAQLHALAGSARAGGMTLATRHAFLLRLARYEADLKAMIGMARTLATTQEHDSPAARAMGATLNVRGVDLQYQMGEFLAQALGDCGTAPDRAPHAERADIGAERPSRDAARAVVTGA
jgi:acyl-CoA dehydrogenase